MNTNNVKKYAPKARKAFIEAMSKQAAKYGITASGIAPLEQKGDLAFIDGRPFPASIIKPRAALVQKIKQLGFTQVIEQVAYSWFNRLCAIRYMELKDYLEHGRRVLSSPNQAGSFQILDDCLDIELAGLDQTKIRALKLDGTQDELLYRELLLAQCHALHKAMPFLFEAVDDEIELLLPENLTKTDSLIHELVNEIPEEDWHSVEIIGWLYQFYISEKKDEVIGKVVKSEDIPAATQLFTPNWIVKYMVQNSLGAQWLATYPESPLKAHMEYYITPAQQTDEVNAQLKAITPSALNPEELTLIDPACGSGHILVEAYDLFKAIYLERGYRQRDIAQLILEKNLFGLDIDQRAAQLTGFALMMKGRDDDRRLFERDIKLNVMAMVDSKGFDVDALVGGVNLAQYGLDANDLIELKNLFEHATTFGSLIQVPSALKEKLSALKQISELNADDLFVKESLENLQTLVKQAELLAQQYDSVVANPPYMGGKGMNPTLKKFAADNFPDAKSDLFASFIERGYTLAKNLGYNAMVTMQSWMFLSSFEKMRERILREKTIAAMVHMTNGVMGIAFGTAATILRNNAISNYIGSYSYATISDINDEGVPSHFPVQNERLKQVAQDEFKKIPGSPVAYWVSESIRNSFRDSPRFESVAPTRKGMVTARNEVYVRDWYEVSLNKNGLDKYKNRESAKASGKKWFSYLKGGGYRKWYGNKFDVVNWENDGELLQTARHPNEDRVWATNFNLDYIFRENNNWGAVTSSDFSARYSGGGELFDAGGSACFPINVSHEAILGFLNAKVSSSMLKVLNPTLNFQAGNIANLPFLIQSDTNQIKTIVGRLIAAHKLDWNSSELSWDFSVLPLMAVEQNESVLSSYNMLREQSKEIVLNVQSLEEKNNEYFIQIYGLQDEILPEVSLSEITLTCNPHYRYGGNRSDQELDNSFKSDTVRELVSYSIGCMMGRYSLDEPGLIYAHSGNEGFDPARYQTFKADDDGIIPLTDKEWFNDDAANRLEEFIAVAWDATHLEENLAFLADNLSPKKGESSRETLRRYLCDSFYKDHTQTYKKRPIYWLFTSGKQKAFQCLVYLHRYNEGTLARMRTQYVIPLTAKMAAYAQKLENDKEASGSAAEVKRLEKEIAQLHKQQAELSEFDEKLRHFADKRISLDLDDGVKVNYGKFGDLLAEVKAITGEAPEVLS